MSLIEEALRRVQDPLTKAQQDAPTSTVAAKTSPQETVELRSWSTSVPPTKNRIAPLRHTSAPLAAVLLAVGGLAVVLVICGAFWLGRALRTPATFSATPLVELKNNPTAAMEAQSDEIIPLQSLIEGQPLPQVFEESFVLSGVVEGLGESYAVINGSIVGVGEPVGTATLSEITKGLVKLRRQDGTEKILKLSR